MTVEADLRAQVKELRRQVRFMQEAAEKKNRDLDAMHMVWCTGGCETGCHRWTRRPSLEEYRSSCSALNATSGGCA